MRTRTFISAMVIVIVVVISAVVGSLWRIEAAYPVFVGLVGLFIKQGFQTIPADPPSKGVLKFFGRRRRGMNKVLKEGLQFLPLRPFVFDVINVNVTKKNVDLPEQSVRAPDMAELLIPVQYTFTPVDLVVYQEADGEEGVKKILGDIIQQELRQWAVGITTSTGDPGIWEDVVRAHDEAIVQLAKEICKRKGAKKPSKATLNGLGNGSVDIPILDLGINLNRLNVGEIKPTGKLAEAAEKAAKEVRERQAEEIELKHVRDQIEKLSTGDLMSPEQAAQLIQTERGKVAKTVDEKQFTIPSETREALERVIPAIAAVFANRSGGGNGS